MGKGGEENGDMIRTWVIYYDRARIQDALCLVAGLFPKLANRGLFWRLAVIDQPCGKFCGGGVVPDFDGVSEKSPREME
jgi:hypothetical protein